jgi:hypothetical protein
VVSAPRGFWQRIAALFLGRYRVQAGYMVTARDAVAVLETRTPRPPRGCASTADTRSTASASYLFPTASCQEQS